MMDDVKARPLGGLATLVDVSEDPSLGMIERALRTVEDDGTLDGRTRARVAALLVGAMCTLRPQ